MATIGDGFKDIFLAGVGAMAITGEKAKDLVDTLISKGELTVDQGRPVAAPATEEQPAAEAEPAEAAAAPETAEEAPAAAAE